MDETRSGVCEVEKVPGIEVHGDESDNFRTGLGDESLSASENIFVGSKSDNSMISEHGREANINMDIDNDYERDICESHLRKTAMRYMECNCYLICNEMRLPLKLENSNEMKCPICGNRDGGCHMKLKEPEFFCITLCTNYEEYSNIPCYVMKYINKSTGNALTIESGDRGVYNFLLDKMKKKTRIFGPDNNKFLTDYDMHQNEKIRFDIIEEEKNVFVIALDIEDYSKELFKGDAKSIFISKTVELKNSEIININSRVYDRGLGLGGVFVHRLSTYDVASNALRIPKTIVSVLDVHRTGDIYFLRGEDDDDSHGVYYTAVYGRIRFKSGWRDFCVKNNLVAGQLVLCLFFKMEGMLFMSVDVIE
ncbi:hypothetical protein ACQ4PT_044310 [Festuca glaucescens]